MNVARITRRAFLDGGIALTIANLLPFGKFSQALAQVSPEARVIAAAKPLGAAHLSGMMWSPYLVSMRPVIDDFKRETGIGIGAVRDVALADAPREAMAYALRQARDVDFFHIDAGMIPSLASAGLLEPLDAYMREAAFGIDAVADYAQFMTYKGATYGVPTDGNVHIYQVRKDLMDHADGRKRYADKHGKELAFPQTFEEDLTFQQFFHDMDKDLQGSGNLRNRANGPAWWTMMFYAAGGFPFDDDMNPTIDTPAGRYALDIYLQEKKAAHPRSAGWGTAEMILRITQGHVAACQYWSGICKLAENPRKSTTVGKWAYGLVPGSEFSGQRIHRSVSSPLATLMVNRHSPRKAQAAYLALWLASGKNSIPIVSDTVDTFHDAWAKAHMTAQPVIDAYTPAGIKAVEANLQVVAPPIYLTDSSALQDALGRNLFDAYTGQLPANAALKKTTEEWNAIIGRAGRNKLKDELASYKAVMPRRKRRAA